MYEFVTVCSLLPIVSWNVHLQKMPWVCSKGKTTHDVGDMWTSHMGVYFYLSEATRNSKSGCKRCRCVVNLSSADISFKKTPSSQLHSYPWWGKILVQILFTPMGVWISWGWFWLGNWLPFLSSLCLDQSWISQQQNNKYSCLVWPSDILPVLYEVIAESNRSDWFPSWTKCVL